MYSLANQMRHVAHPQGDSWTVVFYPLKAVPGSYFETEMPMEDSHLQISVNLARPQQQAHPESRPFGQADLGLRLDEQDGRCKQLENEHAAGINGMK